MPLLDHFPPPLHPHHHWESFHGNWATRIADLLNDEWLPREFIAEEYTHAGTRWEIDVTAFDRSTTVDGPPLGAGLATIATVRPWSPPAPMQNVPAVTPDEIDIVTNRRGNLHNETMRLMEADPRASLADRISIYAAAYRPVVRR